MHRIKVGLLCLLQVGCFFAAGASCAAQSIAAARPPATVADWRDDLDQIVADIQVLHPDPFAKTGRLSFMRQLEALKAALSSMSEEERVVAAMRLVALIGDGHTQLEPTSMRFADWYPIRVYQFTNGYFVSSAHNSVADLAGAQIIEIAGRPIDEVAASARSLMGVENDFDDKERVFAIHNAALMRGLGYAKPDGTLRVKFRLRNGRTEERVLTPHVADNPDYKGFESTFEWQFRSEVFGLPISTPDEWVSAYQNLPASAFRKVDFARPLHLMYRRAYVKRAVPERDAYYAQINQVDDTKFLTFMDELFHDLDQQHPRRVILDLRYNFGGDGSRVDEVIHKFVQRDTNPPYRELYILTGRKTFSAGVLFLADLLKNVPATLVGEPCGAALNSFGDAAEKRYAKTSLVLNVSTLRHQKSSSKDLRSYIPVDVPAQFSSSDYMAGRDPAVDPILEGKEMRGILAVARSDGGIAARKIYLERRVLFGRLDWWATPREVDLRGVCRSLQQQNRMSEALETCKLSAEVEPFVWNSWYNLGELQASMGAKEQSRESFRCVLELDPNNFNGSQLHAALAEAGSAEVRLPPGCPTDQRR